MFDKRVNFLAILNRKLNSEKDVDEAFKRTFQQAFSHYSFFLHVTELKLLDASLLNIVICQRNKFLSCTYK